MSIPTPGPKDYKFNPFDAIEAGDQHRGAMANPEAEVIAQLEKDFVAGWELNARDQYGASLLINACDYAEEQVALWLIERGIDVQVKDEVLGRSALHYASEQGLFQVVKKLVELGLDVNSPSENPKGKGFTPLLLACFKAREARLLNPEVRRVKDNKKVKNHPLATAMIEGRKAYVDLIAFLLERGANPNAKSTDASGTAPLHLSVEGGDVEATALLLSHKADPNIRLGMGSLTPLFFAAREGLVETAVQVLDAGADVNAKDQYGFTALHEAADKGHEQVVKLLLERGADRTIGVDPGYAPYTHKETAADMAKARGFTKVAELLQAATM